MYESEDWTDFRRLDTLGRRAGVPAARLPYVVLKELADNALDYAGACTFGTDGDFFYVANGGAGIEGGPETIASLFSIRRPRRTSKLVRLPTRGALGNGLRVVAGVVLATGGELRVRTNGRSIMLAPQAEPARAVFRSLFRLP
jgi:hypothetical protein